MTIPWPDEDPDAWNTCELGGIDLPGICTVAVSCSQEIEVKKPKGKSGATETRQGYNPAKVTVVVRIVGAADYAALQTAIKNLWPISLGRKADAQAVAVDGPLPIEHPKTRLWGIRAVTITDIDDPPNQTGDVYEVTFKCVEYYPPPKVATATKTSSTTITPRDNELKAKAPAPPSATGNTP